MLNLQSGLIFNWIPTETSCFLKHGLSLTVCVGTQPGFFCFFLNSLSCLSDSGNLTWLGTIFHFSYLFFFFFWALWLKKISDWALTSPVSSVPAQKSGSFKKKRVDFLWQTKNQEHAHNPEACTSTIIHLNIKYTASHALTSQHQTDLTDASDDVMDKKPCS